VKIIFHSHHAAVPEHMRRRAGRLVERAAERIPRIVEGLVPPPTTSAGATGYKKRPPLAVSTSTLGPPNVNRQR
jgi:hypothetical protein